MLNLYLEIKNTTRDAFTKQCNKVITDHLFYSLFCLIILSNLLEEIEKKIKNIRFTVDNGPNGSRIMSIKQIRS